VSLLARSQAQAAAPSLRFRDRLRFAYDEDELTLLWDAVRAAGLASGTAIDVSGAQPPAWWWAATGMHPAVDGVAVRLAHTRCGPVALVGSGDPDATARAAWSAARELDAAAAKRLDDARDGPARPEESPMGAFVTPQRHEEVLLQRLRLPAGTVEHATRIGAGAAPSEFLAFQEAHGDYQVLLVRFPDGSATVGMWAGEEPAREGQAVRPVLRRLFRQQGAWRYGAKFGPA